MRLTIPPPTRWDGSLSSEGRACARPTSRCARRLPRCIGFSSSLLCSSRCPQLRREPRVRRRPRPGQPGRHRHQLPERRARLRVGALRLRHLEVRGHERAVRRVPERRGGARRHPRALQREHGHLAFVGVSHRRALLLRAGRPREHAGGVRLVLGRGCASRTGCTTASRPGHRTRRPPRTAPTRSRRRRSPATTITRNPGARRSLPSEDEWYKAAYYDATLPRTATSTIPAGLGRADDLHAPTAAPNTANCGNASGDLTAVGSYTGSPSPYGTFDQGGNLESGTRRSWRARRSRFSSASRRDQTGAGSREGSNLPSEPVMA